MTTTTKTIGTCPACFRAMALDAKGKIIRHGWNEAGGKRTVGSFGNVYHTGPCFGAGWLPFEVSPAGTIAFFWQIVIPAGKRAIAEVAHLATRPAFVVVSRSKVGYCAGGYGSTTEYPLFSVRISDGEAFEVVEPGTFGRAPHKFSYEHEITTRTQNAIAERDAIIRDGFELCERVATWKPGKLATKAPKVQITHAKNPAARNGTMCRRSILGMNGRRVSHVSDAPTCPDCRARLGLG